MGGTGALLLSPVGLRTLLPVGFGAWISVARKLEKYVFLRPNQVRGEAPFNLAKYPILVGSYFVCLEVEKQGHARPLDAGTLDSVPLTYVR